MQYILLIISYTNTHFTSWLSFFRTPNLIINIILHRYRYE